jgi:hypothetical protein
MPARVLAVTATVIVGVLVNLPAPVEAAALKTTKAAIPANRMRRRFMTLVSRCSLVAGTNHPLWSVAGAPTR